VKWIVTAFLSGIVGLLIGALSMPAIEFVFAPSWKLGKNFLGNRKG
jgi:uncharacterized protein